MLTRVATSDDLSRLVDIHAQSYPAARTRTSRERRFTHNALGPISNAWVVEDGGELVGHGFVHRVRVRVGESWVPCGGVASVAVAHEARGRGVATALLERLHRVSLERGDAFTLLYGFREGFYARLGYGRVTSYRRLAFSPRAVVRATSPHREAVARYELRAARPSDVDDMHALYMHFARSGCVERSPELWRERLYDAFSTVAHSREGLGGWVTYLLSQREPHAPTVLHVTDLQWRDAAARTRLVEHLASLRDQVNHIEVDVAEDDPLDLVLLDGDSHAAGTATLEHSLGQQAAGPMVRIHSIDALAARRYAADGALGVELMSGVRRRLVVRGGDATLDERPCDDSVTTDDATLARIALGGVPVRHAIASGLVSTSSERAAAIAASLFAIEPYFSYDPF